MGHGQCCAWRACLVTARVSSGRCGRSRPTAPGLQGAWSSESARRRPRSPPTATCCSSPTGMKARTRRGPITPPSSGCFPLRGGEARALTHLAGGVTEIAATSTEAERTVVTAPMLHSAGSVEEDARLRSARTRRKVTAILHDSYPVRFWDQDLGPAKPHLLALDLSELDETIPDPERLGVRRGRPRGVRGSRSLPTIPPRAPRPHSPPRAHRRHSGRGAHPRWTDAHRLDSDPARPRRPDVDRCL